MSCLRIGCVSAAGSVLNADLSVSALLVLTSTLSRSNRPRYVSGLKGQQNHKGMCLVKGFKVRVCVCRLDVTICIGIIVCDFCGFGQEVPACTVTL